MASLKDVFQVLNELCHQNVIEAYALGGATAVLFFAEPMRTYDVDVFVFLPPSPGDLVVLTPLYAWLTQQGFSVDAEHVMIHGVPVQFLPSYNGLVDEAILHAHHLDYEGVAVRVVGPEHLIALALQAGGSRRRERATALHESAAVDRTKLSDILTRHSISDPWSTVGTT